tara:strand:- start:4040 stop:5263 length:1224 start_codon:yes stop_codon:yes gene_type:complete
MKIIYLHQYFKTPQMNGGTRSYELAKRLVGSGHEVHIITTHQEKNRKRLVEKIEGINVHSFFVPYDNTYSNFKRIFAFIRFILISSLYVLKIESDLVFATSTPLTIAIPAIFYKKLKKVPMVFEVRDLWPEIPIAIGAIKSKFAIFLAKKLEMSAYNNSEYIIALSPGMKEGIIKSGIDSKKIQTVPNSSDIDLFDVPKSHGEVFRKKYKWINDKKIVLYAGTIGYINDLSYLIYLAKEMLLINNKILFLIVGEGKEKEKIIELAKKEKILNNNLFFLDPVTKAEVAQIYSASTICTSLFKPIKEMWNNSANKFFDTLAAGKPIMINYKGWQSKIIKRDGIGICLNHNFQFSANILNDFINNTQKLNNASKKSISLAKNDFNRDILYIRFQKTLLNALVSYNDKKNI